MMSDSINSIIMDGIMEQVEQEMPEATDEEQQEEFLKRWAEALEKSPS